MSAAEVVPALPFFESGVSDVPLRVVGAPALGLIATDVVKGDRLGIRARVPHGEVEMREQSVEPLDLGDAPAVRNG